MHKKHIMLAVVAVATIGVGCSHPIVITPDVSQISKEGINPIEKNVGYYISALDKEKQVTTPGGGGDKVAYYPYKELEPAIFKVLSNTFRRAYPLNGPDDVDAIRTNDISFVFIPEIQTESSSNSALTWPPTEFKVTLTCKALDKDGKLIWEKKVEAQGVATFSEFKSDFSLAAKRASLKAISDFQNEINTAGEFRR